VKVLLVTMYFPPAGGGGVQRSLKLAQYLPALGVETHVLAPEDPKWVHRESELPVPTQAWVHRVRYVGPRARKPAEELRNVEGLERALVQAQVTARRLLVPDASVTWNLTAIPAAIRIARREGIDAVTTTSPPGSIHFVGAAVQKATGARWLADLRDPLVANPHRRSDTTATRARQAANERLARLVARRADAISCVSDAIADEVRALGARGIVRTISNGCDFDDFAGLEYRPAGRFRITHTGSFFGKRDPRPFLQALCDSGLDAVARFVGDFRSTDLEWAESLGLGERLQLIDYAPRGESLRLQRDSDALLLLVPDAGGRGKGVLSGKVFEYLAAGRPILAVVPPDGEAAELIRETHSGVVVAPDDVDGIRQALEGLHARFLDGGLPAVELPDEARARLSRRARVEETAALLGEIVP
jgi:glycosyltransferase involved in cell wall biosynthesis